MDLLHLPSIVLPISLYITLLIGDGMITNIFYLCDIEISDKKFKIQFDFITDFLI
ncbi:hypothetical protein MA16_Dca027322 [Dendrobium catenatum]|uniref:Uncharacterized protein n=1 Tax=Dendrobium catenatum TaxID=906689 RepID=A0A2I0X9W4_9ASPA|nr:hypothetical protein MA16_Dca027322 [Dendrobium catenatum]